MSKSYKKIWRKNPSKFFMFIGYILFMGIFYFVITISANSYSDSRTTTTTTITRTTTSEVTTAEDWQAVLLSTSELITKTNVFIQVNFEESTEIGSGTIFYQDDDFYYVLTCAHVIDGDLITTKLVRTFDGIESDYEVVASDIDLDLAVIKFIKNDRLSINPISFLTNSVEMNNLVFSVGNPLGIYDYLSIGFIKGFPILQSIELQRDSIEHTAILAPGSSGGALTDEYGQLIGINAWVLNEKYYAIPISDILIFLQNHGLSHN